MSQHRTVRRLGPLRLVRFVVQVLLGVIVLTWAPTVAQAAFSGATVAPVTVGTYAIPAPAGVTGNFSCTTNKLSMTVNLTDFGAVNRATGYTVSLTAPNGQVTTNNLAANTRSTAITRSSSTVGNYTLRIRANVGTWTGQNLERVLTCP
ncbi:hypothetical protein FDK12_05110 [Arthrobacter sp. NamB2]|uniref:hypothetical protein n=1 Tax=Arthrobacter sp. NamB2 TaxID=2576035 RepID=UPI0010CA14CE|nr:hypothetical protein [Arthrobacter sp. NamB2]TKV29035.1 hypothetical protein FDK12_05110 [Arthrobacter sp. NamB2]